MSSIGTFISMIAITQHREEERLFSGRSDDHKILKTSKHVIDSKSLQYTEFITYFFKNLSYFLIL